MMEVILVMLLNNQEYIYDNIHHLQKIGNNVTVICDEKFVDNFSQFNISVITVESLDTKYSQMVNTNNGFRNGFWLLTSYRFTVLEKYMTQHNINNIIHIENDVVIYKNMSNFKFHNKDKILLTMDSENRCIPGIMFIPSAQILSLCLQQFVAGKNDMENWALCYKLMPKYIDTLPIFTTGIFGNNYNYYNSIFDAAAIGQYLGGVDPRNKSGNTQGFVNETCVIKYNNYKFIWKNINGVNTPHIIINNIPILINNLHIHCKNIAKFTTI